MISGRSAASGTAPKEDSGSNPPAWRHVESSRRRSARLSVSSNSIARVIGRAGGNINAIREATGAYIEVEKQTGRKEQHDRQITLKGSDVALRYPKAMGGALGRGSTTDKVRDEQAVEMIHGLIDDSECNVEEVIQRVNSTHNSSIPQSEENTSRSNSALTLTGATSIATAPLTQKKSAAIVTTITHSQSEVSHTVSAGKKIAPYTTATTITTTNVWAQRAAQRQIMSAIGSEKKQKMSGVIEQDSPNLGQIAQPKTSGLVHQIQEISVMDTGVPKTDEVQKHGVKEFCRAPGHARPASASASSPSVSPIDEGQDIVIEGGTLRFKFFLKGLTSPIHAVTGGLVTSTVETPLPNATVTDIKPRTELFEAGPKIEFPQNIVPTVPLSSGADTIERKIQPVLDPTKSNLDVLKAGSINQKLFSPLDPTHSTIMPASIANIWDDNIVDDKPWTIPEPLAPVQLEDFARNINVQLPTSVKPMREYQNSDTTTDRVVDLAKNIANLRTSDDRPISATSNEPMARRTFLGENAPPFGLGGPFPSRDPVEWGNTGHFPTDTFPRWRNAQLDSAPVTVAARLASTRQEHVPFPPTTSYTVPGNSGHVTSPFGTDVSNVNQQQQSTQGWNRMHFQQAAQAASNEYENLTNLLSSYRPTVTSQHQPLPSQQQQQQQQQPPPPIMPMGNININYSSPTAGSGTVGPTGFRMPAPRSQIANTSVPPPPFFNSQIPPPSSMSYRSGIPVTQSSANAAWPSVHFGGQTQANIIPENAPFPQYPSTTRGNWNYNW
uniref:K Homology domain-containing protein n=1 Tax=Setaria digitata TaxID=48799 RepID=A0A915PNI7_9BILA